MLKTHTRKTIPELIELYINQDSGVYGEDGKFPTQCWEWTGSLDDDGYGQLTFEHIHYRAPRFFYEYWTLIKLFSNQLDHLCRNRKCVNPNHLEPVTLQENLRRGIRFNKTHCINKHEFSKENTYITKSGDRQCRACKRHNQKKYMERKSCP